MAIERDFELGEIALILGILFAIGYGIYYVFFGSNSPLNQASNSPQDNESLINKLDAYVFGSSSEGYTEALNETISHPIDTLKSFFGF